jgi:hypothetical protein
MFLLLCDIFVKTVTFADILSPGGYFSNWPNLHIPLVRKQKNNMVRIFFSSYQPTVGVDYRTAALFLIGA